MVNYSNMLLKVKPDGPVYEVRFTSQMINAVDNNDATSVGASQPQAGFVSQTIGSNTCQVGTNVPSMISSHAQMIGDVESSMACSSHMPLAVSITSVSSNTYTFQGGTSVPSRISSHTQRNGDVESFTAHSSRMPHAIGITSAGINTYACQVGTSVPSKISSHAQMNGTIESFAAHNSHIPKPSTQPTQTCWIPSHDGQSVTSGGLLSRSAVTDTVNSVGRAASGSPCNTRTLDNFATAGSSVPSNAVDYWYVVLISDLY